MVLVTSLPIHITGDPLPPGADGVRHGAGRHAGLLPDVLAHHRLAQGNQLMKPFRKNYGRTRIDCQ